jgi:cytochrome c-type biogenesis protein
VPFVDDPHVFYDRTLGFQADRNAPFSVWGLYHLGAGSTIAQGAALLLVYSAGLALPFILVGVGFARVMAASRWLRDRYGVVRAASGAVLVAVGLLLFFDRFWWLNVAVNRTFEFFGVGA